MVHLIGIYKGQLNITKHVRLKMRPRLEKNMEFSFKYMFAFYIFTNSYTVLISSQFCTSVCCLETTPFFFPTKANSHRVFLHFSPTTAKKKTVPGMKL